METLDIRIAAVNLYPVKSCAGVTVDEALVVETGFELDRLWMLVDGQGEALTQRELPRMALIRPELRQDEVVLRAPGMLALHLRVDHAEGPLPVRVWGDAVPAYDMGALAAQWFGDFLGLRCRLARFDDAHRRAIAADGAGNLAVQSLFADKYPLLVTSTASGVLLNERLAAMGEAPVGLERMRANVVLDGLDAHGEDFIETLQFDTADGPVRLQLCEPCVRCTIPSVDPATGVQGYAVGDALAGYRADPRRGGGLTFGMNAAVREGADRVLRVGDVGRATLSFGEPNSWPKAC